MAAAVQNSQQMGMAPDHAAPDAALAARGRSTSEAAHNTNTSPPAQPTDPLWGPGYMRNPEQYIGLEATSITIGNSEGESAFTNPDPNVYKEWLVKKGFLLKVPAAHGCVGQEVTTQAAEPLLTDEEKTDALSLSIFGVRADQLGPQLGTKKVSKDVSNRREARQQSPRSPAQRSPAVQSFVDEFEAELDAISSPPRPDAAVLAPQPPLPDDPPPPLPPTPGPLPPRVRDKRGAAAIAGSPLIAGGDAKKQVEEVEEIAEDEDQLAAQRLAQHRAVSSAAQDIERRLAAANAMQERQLEVEKATPAIHAAAQAAAATAQTAQQQEPLPTGDNIPPGFQWVADLFAAQQHHMQANMSQLSTKLETGFALFQERLTNVEHGLSSFQDRVTTVEDTTQKTVNVVHTLEERFVELETEVRQSVHDMELEFLNPLREAIDGVGDDVEVLQHDLVGKLDSLRQDMYDRFNALRLSDDAPAVFTEAPQPGVSNGHAISTVQTSQAAFPTAAIITNLGNVTNADRQKLIKSFVKANKGLREPTVAHHGERMMEIEFKTAADKGAFTKEWKAKTGRPKWDGSQWQFGEKATGTPVYLNPKQIAYASKLLSPLYQQCKELQTDTMRFRVDLRDLTIKNGDTAYYMLSNDGKVIPLVDIPDPGDAALASRSTKPAAATTSRSTKQTPPPIEKKSKGASKGRTPQAKAQPKSKSK